jgi:tetratricopeptide (TPR) repeat protein
VLARHGVLVTFGRGCATAILLATMFSARADQPPPDVLKFGNPRGFTWGELALLPSYCYDVQSIFYGPNESPRAAHWVGMIGKNFWDMHHYCQALRDFNNLPAASTSTMQRNLLLANIERNLRYMLQTGDASNPLYPEFLLRYGDYYVLMNQLPQAEEMFANARKLKPDYWPAYTRWINVLMSLKLRPAAKELAAEGLRYAPDAKPLRDVFRQLGGDPDTVARTTALAASAPSRAASAPAPPAPAATYTQGSGATEAVAADARSDRTAAASAADAGKPLAGALH